MSKTNEEQDQAATAEMFKHIANYGGGPASPMQMQWGMTNGVPNIWFAVGLTKREQIAAMIANGLLAGCESGDDTDRIVAKSVLIADALLERLKNAQTK